MVKIMPREFGKVTKFDNITGYIKLTNRNEKIYFHEKDIENNSDIMNKNVVFDVEELQNGDKVARNIKELKKQL